MGAKLYRKLEQDARISTLQMNSWCRIDVMYVAQICYQGRVTLIVSIKMFLRKDTVPIICFFFGIGRNIRLHPKDIFALFGRLFF
jgi:hypothetical protein